LGRIAKPVVSPLMPVAHNHLSYVKASRPDWPRGLNFGLGLGLASVLLTWPRKCAIQCKTILVVSILWLYHCNIHYKDVVKHSNVGHNSCMRSWHCHHVFLFRNIYMWLASTFKTWPWPRPLRLGLGLNLVVLTLTSASEFLPHLTSLNHIHRPWDKNSIMCCWHYRHVFYLPGRP